MEHSICTGYFWGDGSIFVPEPLSSQDPSVARSWNWGLKRQKAKEGKTTCLQHVGGRGPKHGG